MVKMFDDLKRKRVQDKDVQDKDVHILLFSKIKSADGKFINSYRYQK